MGYANICQSVEAIELKSLGILCISDTRNGRELGVVKGAEGALMKIGLPS